MRAAVVAVALLAGLVPAAPAAADPCPPGPFTAAFDAELRTRWPQARFTASVLDVRTGCTFSYRPDLRVTTASVFKIEVLAGVLLRAQEAGRLPTPAEEARLRPMITQSANAPTTELFRSLGGTPGFARLHQRFGLAETSSVPSTWGLTATSAADQVRLVRQVLVGDGPLDARSRLLAASYLGSVVPEQAWGLGEALPPGFRAFLKNGFAGSPCCGWRINTAGLVTDPRGGGWVAAVLSDRWPSEAAGRAAMSFVAGALNPAMVDAAASARCRPDVNPKAAGYGADIAPTRSGGGGWVALAEGGVVPFGDARPFGSMAGRRLAAPMVAIAGTPTDGGYWLAGADGGVFSFGDARFLGSTGGRRLNAPVVDLAASPGGDGYWLVAEDGGVFAFGAAPWLGSVPGTGLCWPARAVSITASGGGYSVTLADGTVVAFGQS